MKTKLLCVTVVAALAATTAGCSTQAPGQAQGTTSDGVKAGPGVTATTIQLGYMTDLSGPIAEHGKVNLAATNLYLDQLNAAGGICGRQVKLTVLDNGYDVQKALSLYQQTTPKVLGYMALLGSPIVQALTPRISSDQVTTTLLGWDSHDLKSPNMITLGTTYDLETLNGVAYLFDRGLLKKGDTVGQIYWPGFGQNANQGAQYAADKLGLKLVGMQVAPTDSDMTSQVQQLRAAGAKAIVMSTLPTQVTSVASVSASMGWDVPLLGNNPTFVPQLLKTPAGPDLVKRLYVASSRLPFAADEPIAQEVAKAFKKAPPAGIEAQDGIDVGWANAEVYTDILKRACQDKDLTRAGVLKALRESNNLDTKGLLPTLDFSQVGQPPSRGIYVTQPSATEEGGLKLVSGGLYTASFAGGYRVPTN